MSNTVPQGEASSTSLQGPFNGAQPHYVPPPEIAPAPLAYDSTPYQPFPRYTKGEKVYVFYRFQQNPEELWFPTPNALSGICAPRIGYSDGWTTGRPTRT